MLNIIYYNIIINKYIEFYIKDIATVDDLDNYINLFTKNSIPKDISNKLTSSELDLLLSKQHLYQNNFYIKHTQDKYISTIFECDDSDVEYKILGQNSDNFLLFDKKNSAYGFATHEAMKNVFKR